MHAEKLCHKWLADVFPEMHKVRRLALGAVVSGVLRRGRLTVTALGRSIRSTAKVKHNIKRADRLCSNSHLQRESAELYARMSEQIVGEAPIILIDWSDIDARREFFLLRAAVAVKGRSLTLYEEVHTKKTREKRCTHNQFLRNLKNILPTHCKPIIVTDAGFRTPWFHEVVRLGWDYIGRVRNREMMRRSINTEWIGAKSLYEQATAKAKLFTNTALTQSNPICCSLVLFKGKPKGRKRLTKMKRAARNNTSLKNSARAREPWLLATSLHHSSPKSIVRAYSTRMQIEESFRDLKCPRTGMSLYHNGTYKFERMKVLLLIGSIATNFAWLLGALARKMNAHKQFQANTTFSQSVLSNVFIAAQLFRCSKIKIPWILFKKQIYLTNSNYNYTI